MSWASVPGTGNLVIGSLNTLEAGGILVTDVASINKARLGFTDVSTDFQVNSGGNLRLGDGFDVTSVQGAMLMRNTVTPPTSGDVTSGGIFYVLSGGLHYMGQNGTVTVVASP